MFNVLFCVALASLALIAHIQSDPDLSLASSKPWSRHIPTKSNVKYCKKPISYYSNTTACFHLRILLSGDIQSNPGPQALVNVNEQKFDHPHAHTLQHVDSVRSNRVCYDLDKLYQLNSLPNQLLPQSVWCRVCELGIGRKRRTHRGRKRKIPRVQRSAPITVSSNNLQLGLWNARSLTNKTHVVTDLVVDNNLDILVITESWLSGDGFTLADLKPSML